MDPNQQNQQRDAFLRELERRSLDTIMVYNPTDEDFLIEWDQRFHRVPARTKNMGFGNGKMELARYLAEKYARTMKDKLINEQETLFMEDLRRKKEEKGEPFRDKYEEHNTAFPRAPRTNDQSLINKIYDRILLGLVREFGKDAPLPSQGEKMDIRTPEEKVLENMNKTYKEGSEYEEKPSASVAPNIEPESLIAKRGPGRPTKSTVTSEVAQ